jgi:hypothetical protein
MTTDATNGVSAATAAEQTETLDNNTEKAEHPVKERQHPLAQRESVMSRYEAHRKANVPEAAEQGSLDGAVSTAAIEEPIVEETKEPVVAADPLEKHFVRNDKGVFWKTVVDGVEKLVPLERAQAQLQKHEAADLRLQRASEELREANRLKAEAAKASTIRTPSPTDVSGADDEAVLKEAKELVTSVIEEDDEAAAKKIAAALKSRAPVVDKAALVDEVAEAVSAKQAQKSQEALLVEGYNAYLKEYGPTVNEDPALRAWHAAKADVLAAEHPEWTPKQVMLEAGAQAEKFAGIKRESPTTDSKPAAPLATSRQQRKQELQPVPQSRSAVRGSDQPAKVDNSPRAIIDEMRQKRGQPVPSSRRVG